MEWCQHRFGATEVWLFGSLTQPRRFHNRSDIDLAARGIAADEFFRAVAHLQDISLEFAIDLVDLDRCRPELRSAIDQEKVAL